MNIKKINLVFWACLLLNYNISIKPTLFKPTLFLKSTEAVVVGSILTTGVDLGLQLKDCESRAIGSMFF